MNSFEVYMFWLLVMFSALFMTIMGIVIKATFLIIVGSVLIVINLLFLSTLSKIEDE